MMSYRDKKTSQPEPWRCQANGCANYRVTEAGEDRASPNPNHTEIPSQPSMDACFRKTDIFVKMAHCLRLY